jgi:5-methylcytosine-specific restriction endonuclease McrA
MAAKIPQSARNQRRAKFIALLGGKCVRCGSRKNLEFDHLDPATKAFTLGKVLEIAEEKLLDELKKCVLLCHKCHVKKTRENWEFGQAESKHGTTWRYKKYECRCEKCKEAMSEYMKNYRLDKLKMLHKKYL